MKVIDGSLISIFNNNVGLLRNFVPCKDINKNNYPSEFISGPNQCRMQGKNHCVKLKHNKTIKFLNFEDSKLKKSAFTLSEVLITLVVIGVIAAITIPAVVQKTNEREYAVAMQKARTSIGEAFRLMSINEETDKNITTENFTKYVLSRYLKIIKTCNNANDCEFPEKVTRPDGSILDSIPTTMKTITSAYGVTVPKYVDEHYSTASTTNDTTNNYNNAHFFVTLDGFHVMFFYNPYCVFTTMERPYYWAEYAIVAQAQGQLALDVACFWGVYDMNGKKGPNRVGKDIGFVGSFYNGGNTKAVSVLPNPSEPKSTSSLTGTTNHFKRASDYCNNLDGGNYKLPDVNELSLMFLNRKFVTDKTDWYWSSSPFPPYSYMQTVGFDNGYRDFYVQKYSRCYVLCTRKDTGK